MWLHQSGLKARSLQSTGQNNMLDEKAGVGDKSNILYLSPVVAHDSIMTIKNKCQVNILRYLSLRSLESCPVHVFLF